MYQFNSRIVWLLQVLLIRLVDIFVFFKNMTIQLTEKLSEKLLRSFIFEAHSETHGTLSRV